MHYLTGHKFAKQKGDHSPKSGKNIRVLHSVVTPKLFVDAANKNTERNASLPWEILEAAYFFFQLKGFEKTTIKDICEKLDIKSSQFYSHFESLDEVLEILWAR